MQIYLILNQIELKLKYFIEDIFILITIFSILIELSFYLIAIFFILIEVFFYLIATFCNLIELFFILITVFFILIEVSFILIAYFFGFFALFRHFIAIHGIMSINSATHNAKFPHRNIIRWGNFGKMFI